MPLKVSEIKKSQPGDRLGHVHGLYLEVGKTRRTWKYSYRLTDVETKLPRQFEVRLGFWPDLSIEQADMVRASASAYVERNEHPPQHKSRKSEVVHAAALAIEKEKKTPTVWSAIEDWMTPKDPDGKRHKRPEWSIGYGDRIVAKMTLYFGPTTAAGSTKLVEATRKQLVDALRDIPARSFAALCKKWLCAALDHAADSGEVPVSPIAGLKTSTVADTSSESTEPLSPAELCKLLPAILSFTQSPGRGQPGQRQTAILLELLLHCGLRTSEARCGRWSEIDWTGEVWRIPGERMKMKLEHRVPLTPYALSLLHELREIVGPDAVLMFPHRDLPGEPMSRTSARGAMVILCGRAGIDQYTPHCLRAALSTIANEGGFNSRVVDAMLAHRKQNGSEGSYNKATYYDARRAVHEAWSAWLTGPALTGPFLS